LEISCFNIYYLSIKSAKQKTYFIA